MRADFKTSYYKQMRVTATTQIMTIYSSISYFQMFELPVV